MAPPIAVGSATDVQRRHQWG